MCPVQQKPLSPIPLPKSKKLNTLQFLPNAVADRTLRLLPIDAHWRMEQLPARRAFPSTEAEEPVRTKLRTDKLEPRLKKSKADMVEPNFPAERTDKEEPRLAKFIRLIRLPPRKKARMERVEPGRKNHFDGVVLKILVGCVRNCGKRGYLHFVRYSSGLLS